MTRQSGFYGWKLLGVFWIILFANFAFPLYGASVVNTYMAEALHWDRTQLGLAYAVYQLMIGVPAPLIAILIARKGVRFTTALGCWIVVAGALLMSFVVHTSWQVDLVYGVIDRTGRDDRRSARRTDRHQPLVQPVQRTRHHACPHRRHVRRLCRGATAGQSDSRVRRKLARGMVADGRREYNFRAARYALRARTPR